MDFLSSVLSIASSLATFGAVMAVPSALGVAPRLGPGRAVVLALKTYRPPFFSNKDASQRVDDVRKLRALLSSSNVDQYMVVSGPKGVGKTRIVNSALYSSFGVVFVRVPVGTGESQIKTDVFNTITRCQSRFIDTTGSARRVIWWHRVIFRTPVTVVLEAAERKPSESFAAVDGAARALTQNFGVRVVIDASNNSLPDAAVATKREVRLDVEAMSLAQVEALPELASLLDALKKADLADVVWACIGGNPADYKSLGSAWKACSYQDIGLVVSEFLQELLAKALDHVDGAVAANEHLHGLYAMFRDGSDVPTSVLRGMKLVRPSPDKVLRSVRRLTSPGSEGSGQRILVPVDAATALVLRYGLDKTPSIEQLKAMLRK